MPISDHSQRVLGALTIYCPVQQFQDQKDSSGYSEGCALQFHVPCNLMPKRGRGKNVLRFNTHYLATTR